MGRLNFLESWAISDSLTILGRGMMKMGMFETGRSARPNARAMRETECRRPGRIASALETVAELWDRIRKALFGPIEYKHRGEITLKENGERDLEADVGVAILRIASEQSNNIASYPLLRQAVPAFVEWDQEMMKSRTPPPDEFWENLVSRISQNHMADGNILRNGYATHHPQSGFRITWKGCEFLKKKGYRAIY